MTEHEHDHNHPHDAATQEEKPPQKVTVEDIGPARKRLTIELPESRIQQKIESTYQQLRDDAVIPGFRRGRAPRRLIERRFGTSVRSDVKGQIISEAYAQAVEDEKLQVIGQPDIKDVDQIELPESGPLTFQVEVEVAPQVELPAFEELAVTKRTAPVTDQNVESEIERYRERFGQMKPVENAEIEEGDFVQAHVRILAGQDASDEAELIEEHPDTYILVPGEDRQHRGHVAGIVVEDLGEHLIGQQVGQTVTISMTGPAGHENEKIKGQPITLKIQLQSVQRLEPAPLEELIQRTGAASAEELSARVRQMLEERRQQEQQADMHQQVCEQLLEKTPLELPEGLTGRQTQRVLQRRRLELLYRGLSEQEVEQQIAEMRSGSEEEARRQLKLFFIIDQAAQALEVEVSEAEINGRIAMMAMQHGRRPEKLRQEMQRRGELEQIYLQIREQKTLDKILEKAKITEAPAQAEEAPAAKAKSAGKKTTKRSTTKKKKSDESKSDES